MFYEHKNVDSFNISIILSKKCQHWPLSRWSGRIFEMKLTFVTFCLACNHYPAKKLLSLLKRNLGDGPACDAKRRLACWVLGCRGDSTGSHNSESILQPCRSPEKASTIGAPNTHLNQAERPRLFQSAHWCSSSLCMPSGSPACWGMSFVNLKPDERQVVALRGASQPLQDHLAKGRLTDILSVGIHPASPDCLFSRLTRRALPVWTLGLPSAYSWAPLLRSPLSPSSF